ncbi:MAG: FtsX-like permease family protein [Proteobacteria bacterium]|nr:FtsX-like permease family protein [Pseudomonadota bacterium]
MNNLRLAWRLARRELRGSMRSFRIFLLCLATGVAAIAAIGSLSESLNSSMRTDARAILGGDIDLRLSQFPASEEQIAWLNGQGRVSNVIQMRSMARAEESHALIELKAVDDAYPLFGNVVLTPAMSLPDALARQGGDWGAVVEAGLLARLGLNVGDRMQIGDAWYRIAATLTREPDQAGRGLAFGLRVIVSGAGLEASGLVTPGSLIRYHYRIGLPRQDMVSEWRVQLDERFPEAGWRVRDTRNASPGLGRAVDRISVFLVVIGLTALLVGGVGVGNSVRAFLLSRTQTIATLKCLGASGSTIFYVYLIQVMLLASAGIAAGLVVGALLPLAAGAILAGRLPIDPEFGVFVRPLALAALFGFLVTFTFSYWPLARARAISAATLFRHLISAEGRLGWRAGMVMAGLVVLLAVVVIASADDRRLAIYFVAGATVAMAAFRLSASAIQKLAARLPHIRQAHLRLAVASLHRPGAPTAAISTSLGMGLTVLIAVALVEGNLSRHLGDALPKQAPGLFFIDIQSDQAEGFDRLAAETPGIDHLRRVPMLRGRITAIGGTPVDQFRAPANYGWVLRGDRGLTWAREAPGEGSEMVEGTWWPADYSGPPLVSFDEGAARAFGIGTGDKITLNVLGREFEAEIANLRRIDWDSFSINFVMILSPGVLDGAPQSQIATVRADDPAREVALEDAVVGQFPNITAIRVREILNRLRDVVGNLATAIRSVAGVAIVTGLLVLTGAILASRKQRIYDAVVLKVLGATRRDVLLAFLIEFGLLGFATAVIAGIVGTAAAWGIVTRLMQAEWIFLPGAVIATALACLAATVIVGTAGTWSALGRKAAPLLRNE